MPIYEYECAACGGTFEAWQKINDRPVGKCQHCGSRKVSKLISQSAFHLKGSGWYKTDYAGKGNGGSETRKASAKKDTDSKAGATKVDTPKADTSSAAPEKKAASAAASE